MPPLFQQQLSAHASLLTSPHPHPSFQLMPRLFSPHPHKSTRPYMISVTAIPTQPLIVSRLASTSHIPALPHASPLPLKFSCLLILLLCCSHAFPQEHRIPLPSFFRIFTPWVFWFFTPGFVVCVIYHVGMQ